MNRADRIRAHTVVASYALVPELRLHVITDACALWHATEEQAAAAGIAEPYWAFAWPGGQALARFVLDHPELVRGRRVFDLGSGSAIEGLAALRSGAASVLAADIDPLAGVAARLNAALNGLGAIDTTDADLIGTDVEADVVLAGDVFYDRELAQRARAWLTELAARGTTVLFGDPSRGFLDLAGLERLAAYRTGSDGELAGPFVREAGVYRVPPGSA